MSILWNAKPIPSYLNDPNISADHKRKLKLILEAKEFAVQHLGLKPSKNYQNYSVLKNSHVSYVVNATTEYSLAPYKWNYPIVGNLSYKGFHELADAKAEEKELKKQGLDTFVRGVSAYSTLGWFNDPVLSSMMNYEDYDLVEIIFHELTHKFVYIKSNAEFNEQLASFFGRQATRLFYEKRNPEIIELLKNRAHDEKLFSKFIGEEKEKLSAAYELLKLQKMAPPMKQRRKDELLMELQERFKKNLQPKLKVLKYNSILSPDLNNARLSLYGTYEDNQESFQKLYDMLGATPQAFLAHIKKWENEKKPLETLKGFVK